MTQALAEKPKKSLSLYDISEELSRLDAILELSGGALPEGQEGETFQAWLEKYEFMEATKVDRYGEYWRNIEAEEEMCVKEAARFLERARIAKNKKEGLKAMAMLAMKMRGKDVLAGTVFKLAKQKNGGKVPVEILEPYLGDPMKLPEVFKKASWSPDSDAIREALEKEPTGVVASVARLGDVGYHVRLR